MNVQAGLCLCDSYATKSGQKVIKLLSCSTQLSTKFILLINVKMPTYVGILTFISRINTPTWSLTARKLIIFQLSALISSFNFMLIEHEKFYNLEARFSRIEAQIIIYISTKMFIIYNVVNYKLFKANQ